MRKLVFAVMALIGLGMAVSYDAPVAASPSWDQTVEIAVPLRERIMDFVVEGAASGDGSEANPYPTYTSNISLALTVNGPGEIIVTDGHGNVIYSFDKTSSGSETFTFNNALSDGVGEYGLTATFVDLYDPNVVYDSKTIYVSFLPTSIGTVPEAPDTGVLYLGERAFLVRDVSFMLSVVSAVVIIFLITRVNRSRRKV